MAQLTSVALAASVGVVVSFILATFPKVRDMWAKVSYKAEIMAVVFILAPFAVLGLSCSNVYLTQYGCPAGAFVTPQFYIENAILGFTAFAASQWSFANGAEEMQKK